MFALANKVIRRGDTTTSRWAFSNLLSRLAVTLFAGLIIIGGVPFIYILGSSMLFLFLITFSVWFISVYISSAYMLRFFCSSLLVSILLVSFDTFVVMLRPVTLILRILINVSLGHFLILFVHVSMPTILTIILVLELFVYLVQFYVFLALAISYLDLAV